MTQSDIDHAVACVTGEDLTEIRRRGFSLADPADADFDPEPDNQSAQVIDWDDYRFDTPSPVAGHIDKFLKRRSA